MTKERKDIMERSKELFKKRYPQFVMNGEPLSSNYNLFASGYEIATAQLYLQIKELQEENKQAKKVLKDVITWAEWEGPGCPKFNDIKKKIENILNEIKSEKKLKYFVKSY